MAEALNGSFKAELIEHQGPWRDADQVEHAVIQWVGWYNAEARAALLDLVVQLGRLLRGRNQAARGLTLTLRFAGNTSWDKTRRLAQASAHDDDLRTLAYQLMDAAGLQSGQLMGIALRADDLVDADWVAEQISLDHAREARLKAEAASDRIRDKFGPGVIGPAAAFRRVS